MQYLLTFRELMPDVQIRKVLIPDAQITREQTPGRQI